MNNNLPSFPPFLDFDISATQCNCFYGLVLVYFHFANISSGKSRGSIDCMESLRFLRSSEVTLGQGLLRKGGGRGIYPSTSKLSIYVTKTGLSISIGGTMSPQSFGSLNRFNIHRAIIIRK